MDYLGIDDPVLALAVDETLAWRLLSAEAEAQRRANAPAQFAQLFRGMP